VTGPTAAATVQRLLELTHDGVVVVAPDGSVLAHNHAAADLLALHPDDLRRQRFTHHQRAQGRELMVSDARGQRRQVVVRAETIDWYGTPADLVTLHARTLSEAASESAGDFHDPLTGLPGRELLLNRLHELVRLGKPEQVGVTLVRIDLDRFHAVNDRHGIDVGDAVLQGVANRLTLAVRPGDYVARLGEDDFMVVLSGSDAEGGQAVATRVLTALRRPFEIEGTSVRCQPAAALIRHRPGQSEADLLAAAEAELISRPVTGLDGPGPLIGGPGGDTGATGPAGTADADAGGERVSRVQRTVSRTLDEHHLDVYYLPRVDLGDGRLDGLHARIYRDHPDDGIVPVDDLWRVAEQGGALLRPGEWLLRQVLDHALEWRERRRDTVIPPVTVMLASNELLDPELGRDLAVLLGRRGVSPAALRIGVDAAVLLDSGAAVVATLDKLLADGLRLELVDFGAGPASLRVLTHKGVGAAALDPRLLDRVPSDEEMAAFVQAVINAAHTLGLRVTATGVERADQRAALYRWGCDAAEGPAVGPALTALEAAARLVTTSPGRLAGAPLLRSRGR
jgi:diguanylate cyclase (GGDEF)-like protein